MHMKKKVARLAKHYLSSTGSTLIELLIATMIVGTIVTAVAAGVTNSVKNNAESRYLGALELRVGKFLRSTF